MPEDENYLKETRKKLKEYIRQHILLIQLQATGKFSQIATAIITSIFVVVIALFLLIFASITAGLWLAHITGSLALGFGIVALFYFLIFLFMILFMKKILHDFFINKFIQLFHKKD